MKCPSCCGSGRLVIECCDGSHGCSCHGGLVDVGSCKVCGGSGYVDTENYDSKANVNWLKNTGACFAGSGHQSGIFRDSIALNGNPIGENE